MIVHSRTRTAIDLLLFAIIVALYAVPFIYGDLYYNDGVRYGGIVRDMMERDAWLTLNSGGAPYLDKPPVYFILLRLAAEIAGEVTPQALILANAATLFIYVGASYGAFRVMGTPERTARIAAFMLLSLPICGWFANGLRMDFLFAAPILGAFAFLVRGLDADAPNWRTLTGGFLAGIAVLVKGPFGLLFPFGGLLAYLVVTGRARRILRRDVLAALAITIGLLLLWLVALLVEFGRPALQNILDVQLIERAMQSVDGRKPWHTYVVNFPLILLPWLVLLIPAFAVKPVRARLMALDRPALAWLCLVVVALVIMQSVAQKSTKYLFPLLPVAILWIATGFEALEAQRPRLLSVCIGIMACGGALLFGALAVAVRGDDGLLGDLRGYVSGGEAAWFFALAALASLVAAGGAWLSGWVRILPMVAATALVLTFAKAIVGPGALALYSPVAVAEVIDAALPDNGRVLAYRVYRGTLSYHLDQPQEHVFTPEAALSAWTGEDAPDVLVTWGRDLPAELAEISVTPLATLDLAGDDITVWQRN